MFDINAHLRLRLTDDVPCWVLIDWYMESAAASFLIGRYFLSLNNGNKRSDSPMGSRTYYKTVLCLLFSIIRGLEVVTLCYYFYFYLWNRWQTIVASTAWLQNIATSYTRKIVRKPLSMFATKTLRYVRDMNLRLYTYYVYNNCYLISHEKYAGTVITCIIICLIWQQHAVRCSGF